MSNILSPVLSLTVCAALLGACAGMPIYYGEDFSALYRRTEVAMAAAQGPVPLRVRGTAFAGISPGASAAAVADALARAPALAPMRPTLGDPGPRQVDYRIVLAFGEPRIGANGLCAAQDDTPPADAPGAATISFCIGERMLSTARGRMGEPPRAPDDPRFAAFLAGLVDSLLPMVNPRLRPKPQSARCQYQPC